jgi:membrane-associated protease RseP (regulator of RpoE activity)
VRSLPGLVADGNDIVGGNMWVLLLLLGQISLILALFNLIPLVPFDGGHAVVVLYEWVATKISNRRVRVDYRRLVPVSVVLLLPLVLLVVSAMVVDARQLGQ